MEEAMDDTGTINIRKLRVTFWAITAAGGATVIALACLAAASMHATAIKAETVNTQSVQVELAKGDTTPAALEIKPSPVIEPDPGFFVGAGDGSNGYYAERPPQ
jgi:hypothetical protein